MHFVGKILVALQVVLSILFMAFAGAVYSVHQNWKVRTETLQANYDELDRQSKGFQETAQRQQTEATAAVKAQEDRANAAEARLRNATLANQTLTAERDAVRREKDTLIANSDINDREARERRAEAVVQRGVNDELHKQRDQLRDEIKSLQDLVFSKDVEMRRMVDRQTQALEQLALWQRAAQAVGLKPDPRELAGQQDPPPLVYGKVLDARPDSSRADHDYVEISLGADDGLLKGHELHVYTTDGRGKYLGKIRIVQTQADRSVAIVIEKTRNGRIQRGNDVTTQL
ncbi:MAG TPA: hypothetical protein VML55_01485 [Planctomycetaceae bacterium]|nr:hypothetical protein [Planctomycetaceae bacterium]